MSNFHKLSPNYNSTQPPFINARSQLINFPSTSVLNFFQIFYRISREIRGSLVLRMVVLLFPCEKAPSSPWWQQPRGLREQSCLIGGGTGESRACVCVAVSGNVYISLFTKTPSCITSALWTSVTWMKLPLPLSLLMLQTSPSSPAGEEGTDVSQNL